MKDHPTGGQQKDGLISRILGRLRRSGTQADTPIVTSYLDTRGTTHTKNIGITDRGTLFPFNSTYLQKPLKVKQGKWFDGSEYFASTIGLNTGYTVLIEDTPYRVMRVDRKRGKYWLSQRLPQTGTNDE